MSSILTNGSAMNALHTLRALNSQIETTQLQVSTGKVINNAKDNASMWAVANTMDSDIQGFEAVSRSLSLGMSTVSVARKGSETIVELLNQMKSRIIAAQDDNVDRASINNEINELKAQIQGVVESSQFNGVNLLNGSTRSTNILATLKRSGTNVTAENITVAAQDMRGAPRNLTKTISEVTNGTLNRNKNGFTATVNGSATMDFTIQDNVGMRGGDTIKLNIDGVDVEYVFDNAHYRDNAREAIVAFGLKQAIEDAGITSVTAVIDPKTPNKITLKGTNSRGQVAISAETIGYGSGPLGNIKSLSVSNDRNAASALDQIDDIIKGATDAAAKFGAYEKRLELQTDYIKSLIDTMEVGVGAIVDADMEKVSATMQGLQVQQQLGVQALAIANRNPQNLLSLFR